MLRWFKRQSAGVQTLTLAAIVVLLVVLASSGGDDGDPTSAADPPSTTTRTSEPPARSTPPGPAPEAVVAAFEATGLPAVSPRDTTSTCADALPGCVARVTSDSITVLAFDTVGAARHYARTFGHDARRYGATVVSYAAARTPGHLRPQYAAVLDAVAVGGDGHAARRRIVVAQRREARRRQLARERRIAEQQAAAERAAATPPPAPEPEPEPVATPDYSGMNCSEIGHSFHVTPGSDPDHDADNDGVACESQ